MTRILRVRDCRDGAARVVAWWGVGCAILLLAGCGVGSTVFRPDSGTGSGNGGRDGAAGGGMSGGGGGGGTGAGGSSGASGTGGAIVACGVALNCAAGSICVPDPRVTCVAGTPCPNICLTGSRYCLNVTLSDGGPITECPPGQYLVTCRPTSCEGSNDCTACVEGTATNCDPATPCPVGQLCIPVRACANAAGCGSVCVVP